MDDLPPELQARIMSYFYQDIKDRLAVIWKPWWRLDPKARRLHFFSLSLPQLYELAMDPHIAYLVRMGLIQKRCCWSCGMKIDPYCHPLDHLFWIVCCHQCYFDEERDYLRTMHGDLPSYVHLFYR